MLFRMIVVCSLFVLCCGLSGCEDSAPPPPADVNTDERPVDDANKIDAPGAKSGDEPLIKGGGN